MISPTVNFDTKQFTKDMNNIAEYAIGFLEGAERGRLDMMYAVAESTREILEEYIDASARVAPDLLHHVYEWYMTGSPQARLFEIKARATSANIEFDANFTQSKSLKSGAKKPFYNKAMVMEKGIPLTIRPRESKVLAFEDDGEQVFTRGPVTIQDPGGPQVQGSFDRVFREFFNNYFSQSFLRVSGLQDRLDKTDAFVKNISRGKAMGKAAGNSVGYRWITGKGGN
jgi:hypothetical protein